MLDYPSNLRIAVNNAVNAWVNFSQLPQEEKQLYAASNAFDGAGYEQKVGGKGVSNDHKENFDITSSFTLKDVPAGATAQSFIDKAQKMAQLLQPEITKIGNDIANAVGEPGLRAIGEASIKNYYIRFIHYPPTDIGETIGEAHVDHSGFTFHLYESTDGCERLSPTTTEWLPFPVADGKMAAFGGMQLQLATNGTIKALCHRISANEQTSSAGRFVVVCFVSLQGIPKYDRNTHGRLQQKEPGFNYNMSPGDFAKLFTTS